MHTDTAVMAVLDRPIESMSYSSDRVKGCTLSSKCKYTHTYTQVHIPDGFFGTSIAFSCHFYTNKDIDVQSFVMLT